jgi:hypothetical protein
MRPEGLELKLCTSASATPSRNLPRSSPRNFLEVLHCIDDRPANHVAIDRPVRYRETQAFGGATTAKLPPGTDPRGR